MEVKENKGTKMRTTFITKKPDGIRIQNIFGSVFMPEDEIDEIIYELVSVN